MEYYTIALVWIARMVIMAVICTFLGLLGVRILDALTPKIEEREKIGEDPVATGLFIAGFIIFIGLVIHGACTAPIPLRTLLIPTLIDFKRLGLVMLTFFVSLLLGVGLFNLIDKLTPKIVFSKVNDSPVGVGIYVAGYLVFLGLILHAALTVPL
jgi:uncharacterized membrane protein YjfL (UPF0719 family)